MTSMSSLNPYSTPRSKFSSYGFRRYSSATTARRTALEGGPGVRLVLSKDKSSLAVNESLTLRGIPPDALSYRLGNRSALEWVIDQYQVGTDKRSGITSDPNLWGEERDDDEYIVRLVKQVVAVSLETNRIVRALPVDFGAAT
jgi:hypothetical protein